MREILFRGKRLDNGEWVEGCLVVKDDPVLEISYCFILSQGRGDSFVTWHKVDTATVGQYTGLTVKTGKVFDGDILVFVPGFNERFEVAWCEKLLRFVLRQGNTNVYCLDRGCGGSDCEIVGNIYDNPELLEGCR